MSYLGVGISPGNVTVYHGTEVKVIDRRVRLLELVLRCVICGLGILSTVLVATDTQVKEILMVRKKAKYTDMKALVFLVIANGLAAGYSLLQGVRCVVSLLKGNVLLNKPLAWVIFSDNGIPDGGCGSGGGAVRGAGEVRAGQSTVDGDMPTVRKVLQPGRRRSGVRDACEPELCGASLDLGFQLVSVVREREER
ncbi:hypothetical protein QQ045_011023 [Rhodiola kirilowii]